jgi:hypothetical protein
MRTDPRVRIKDDSEKIAEIRFKKISKNVAIAFILIVQLAIIYKMLL